MGGAAIGARELEQIQQAVQGRFGKAAVESPAAIARVLADEGAQLRHPEVIEFDANWREARIMNDVSEMDFANSGKPCRLKQAVTFIKKVEKLRLRFERTNDNSALKDLRETAIKARQEAFSFAKNRTLSDEVRAEQTEIAAWFALWLQTPALFNEWLELRRRSPEFQEKFQNREP